MNRKYILLIILAITSVWPISLASVDYGRTIYDGTLPNSGHGWANYSNQCKEKFYFEFNFNNLTGGMQANLNVNGSNRYAIGFINLGNSSLATYLFRQEKEKITYIPGKTISYHPSETYHVEAIFRERNLQALIKGVQDLNSIKIIDYSDNDPLPLGVIDLETLENSSVQFSGFTINCEEPEREKLPNLGIGYFKRPS